MKKIIVVGRGSSAAVTALQYYLHGYTIEVIAKGPEPTKRNIGKEDFMCSSLTGPLNIQRYITGIEGNPRNSFAYNRYQTPDRTQLRTKSVQQGGWLSKPLEQFSSIHQSKIKQRVHYYENHSLSKQKHEYETRIQKNIYSLQQRKNTMEDYPELFLGTDIQGVDSGVLKLFTDKKYYKYAKIKFKAKDLLASDGYYQNGNLFGFREKGCNISLFGNVIINIKDYLKQRGVIFHFNTEVSNINMSAEGKLESIITNNGKIFENNNFSFHMGAYNTAINSSINTVSDIFPVGGLRTSIELTDEANEIRTKYPIKLHPTKKDNMFGWNINIAKIQKLNTKTLLAGYGYIVCETPCQNLGMPLNTKQALNRRFEKEITYWIPKKYIKTIHHSSEICYRSFSINDRESIHHIETTNNGKALFCNGGNAGTTTMSFADAKKSIDIIDNIFNI